jgi:hypothetical protein
MSPPRGDSERRRHPRLKGTPQLRFRILRDLRSTKPADMPSELRDISGGGLCFQSKNHLPIGQMLAMDVVLPNTSTPLVALGRVRRCAEAASGGMFEIGIEFCWGGLADDEAQDFVACRIREALNLSSTIGRQSAEARNTGVHRSPARRD